jgi:hypothetical protein
MSLFFLILAAAIAAWFFWPRSAVGGPMVPMPMAAPAREKSPPGGLVGKHWDSLRDTRWS